MDELGAGKVLYGCMRIGGAWSPEPPSERERETAFRALDAAREAGARLFDHADIYGCGRSETLFGEWMRSRGVARDEVLLQSKCGIRPGEGELPDRYDFSRDHILKSVEEILGRLGVEFLDILMLHRPDPLGDPQEVAAAVGELKRRGWIGAFGVSNFSAAQIRLYQKTLSEPIRVNQLEISLRHVALIESGVQINRVAAPAPAGVEGLLEFCREQGIDVQAWSPLAKGRSADDSLDAVLKDLAARHAVSSEAIQIAWLLRHPANIRPVVGTTRPERIRGLFEAGGLSMSREEWYRLFNAARPNGGLP